MPQGPIEKIVILGGGTAGWMAAAAIAKAWQQPGRQIVLIESDEIGIVGVGEATVPSIHLFNSLVGIDTADVMRATGATFKLGIEFDGWGGVGRRYMHPFSGFGANAQDRLFPPLWLKYAGLRTRRGADERLDLYNLNSVAAYAGRFDLAPGEAGAMTYAFHFDAALYARYLRGHAERRGVVRREGKVAAVDQDADTGFILGVTLDSGEVVAGDFFIDCSGFRGLLIGDTLKTGYDDWSHWLPCDRAIAVASANAGPPPPYTKAIADQAGWRWRIPLQHRTGNGYVYASAHMDDDAAEARLLDQLEGATASTPRRLRFVTGRRHQAWNRNCLALGLAAGFLEPLESTSIHLIQTSILRLISLFPDKGFEPAEINEFNRQTRDEYDDIRDFLITHYKLTTRDDTAFWRYCRDMAVPDRVAENLDLFAAKGRLMARPEHLFSPHSWLAVLVGQGLMPRGADPLLEGLPEAQLAERMDRTRQILERAAAAMPRHETFIGAFCNSQGA